MPSLINDYLINGHVTKINQSDCDTSRSRREFPHFLVCQAENCC